MSMMRNSSAAFPGRSHRASMVMGHHSHHHSSSGSPVCSPCHTPPTGGGGGGSCHGHPNSILHPVNQMYLASKGYYRQQGWPQGTYLESEEEQLEQAKGENQTDASSKRKMFQKTRSQRQNWSLCASGEKDANGTTGAADISSEPSPERQVENGLEPTEPGNRGRGVDDWFTRSMDDSLSQDEGARARVDSVGQNNTFFSTTTEESSTDSLDNAGSETERALEEIRRQYYEGQFGSVPSTDGETSLLTSSGATRKESEDLFIPCRRAPLQKSQRSFSDTGDSTSGVFSEEGKEKHVGFRLGTGRRFQNGAAVDYDDGDDDDDNNNNNAAVGVRMRVRGSEGDDEGPGGNLLLPDDFAQHSNNYFISPASSRQTTVEKSPTLPGSHEDDFPPHLSDDEGEKKNSHVGGDDNNNNNNSDKAVVDENNRANMQDKTACGGEFADGQGDVKIIVSSFSSGNISPQCGRDTSCRADKTGNKLTVERAQQASSDSGSSSSGGTAVNSAMATEVELDTDATTPRNVLSEESDGITDRDSISRTHSPYGFPPSRPDSGGRQRTNSQRAGSVTLSTSVSQTSEADFILAAQAEQGEAINATVRSSTAMSRAVSSGRRVRGSSERDSGDSSSSGGPGGGRETGKRNGKVEDDAGNKVKLSALPPSINPLELMRRLRHSQEGFEMGQLLSAPIFSIVRERAGGAFPVEDDTTDTRDDNENISERCGPETRGEDVEKITNTSRVVDCDTSSPRVGRSQSPKFVKDHASPVVEYGKDCDLHPNHRDLLGTNLIRRASTGTDGGCVCFHRRAIARKTWELRGRTDRLAMKNISLSQRGSPYALSACLRHSPLMFSPLRGFSSPKRPHEANDSPTKDGGSFAGSEYIDLSRSEDILGGKTTSDEPQNEGMAHLDRSIQWCDFGHTVPTKTDDSFTVGIPDHLVHQGSPDKPSTGKSCCESCLKLLTHLRSILRCQCESRACNCSGNPQMSNFPEKVEDNGGEGRPLCHCLPCPPRSKKSGPGLDNSVLERRMRSDSVVTFDILYSGHGKSVSSEAVDSVGRSEGDSANHGCRVVDGRDARSDPVVIVEQPRGSRIRCQNEFLRAGSVQSDSSGFGDADPTTDSGQFDTDQPKVQGSGSNHDSGESTLANSYNSSSQQQRQQQQHAVGDMSTQTSDSAMGTLSLAEEERLSTAQSPQSSKGNNFITTCFIPSLNRQEEDLRHRHVSRPSSSSSSLHHQQSRPQNLHQSQPDLHQPSPSHQLPGSLGRTPPYGYKSEISIYMPQDEATNPQPPYPYQRLQGTVPTLPPHHFPSPYPQGYSSWLHHQALAEEERYARQRRTSLGGRSVMSDSEWSRYGDFYHPLNYSQDSGSYNYGRYPGRFQGKSHSRRMSLDFYDSYEDDFDYMMHSDNERRRFSHADARERIRHSKNLRRHGQGHHRAQSQDEGQPRRYRSELELFTSGSGKLEQKQHQQFERSQSEEGVLDDASPQPRNQVPLSEELAAASAGRMSPSYQVTITPAKSAQGLDASSDASKLESFSSDNRGSSRRVSSKIVIVPPSPTVTLTPATPEPTRHGTPTTSLSSKQIMGQDLPPLAGNLRNIPQSPVNTSMSDPIYHPLSTQVTPTSKATPSKPPVLVSSSSSSAAAAAAGFRSRKQRSCDILDDSYDGSFSEEGILSTPSHSGNSQNQSAAAPPTTFVSTVYHQTKGRFTSQQRPVSNSAPSSPLSERPPSLPGLNPRLVSPRHKHYPQRMFSSPRQTYQPNWPGFPPSPHGSHMPPSPLSQPFSPFRSASSSSSLPPYPYSHHGPEAGAYPYSRFSEDYEGYYSSSVAESSSDFSLHSSPELGGRAEVTESRRLARLINQPVYFKGARRPGCHYRPRRLFKEWMLLGKRKRLQEENRLLQSALSRYKTELGVLETSLKADYAASADDMPPEERQKMEDLEWLWSEVRTQVQEMENLLLARIKSVQSGNNFHMLLTNLSVINKITDLIKEQTYQQQVVTSRMEDADDEDDDEEGNDADNMMNEDEDEPELEFDDSADEVAMYEEDYFMDRMGSSRGSNHSYHGPPRRHNRSYHGRPHSQKIYPGRASEIGTASTARYGPSSRSRFKQRWPSGFKGQVRNSFSTSNLAREDLNASLEQVKSSLLTQVQREIEENTRKLQYDLEAKTKEIEELKKQMGSRTFSPEVTYRGASAGSISSAVRADQGQGRQTHKRTLSRSRVVGDRIVQETDV